jgi:NAD(P)-dependent dehydrogenase (short-subunit alcohol dehydrogenase family)
VSGVLDEPVDDDGDVTPEPDTEEEAGRGGHLVAVVTGASRGIGRYVADSLDDAGWVVERGSSTVAPLTDRGAVEAWVGEVVERQGRIDLLVNNAGVIDTEVDVLASDPDEWWWTVEVNVRGAYLMTRTVGASMVTTGGGRIVNLNSGAARRAGEVASAYNVSKTALARLTGSTHLAGWHRGIRAFDLMPGVVRTDMTLGMEAHAERTQWTPPEAVTRLVLALASGELDAFSGRFVRAGVDTPESLRAMAERGLDPGERTLDLRLREQDPLGP